MYIEVPGPAHPDDQIGYVGTFKQLTPFFREGGEQSVVDVYVIPGKDWGDNVVLRYGPDHMYDSMSLELLFSAPNAYPHFYTTARFFLSHRGKLSWSAKATPVSVED